MTDTQDDADPVALAVLQVQIRASDAALFKLRRDVANKLTMAALDQPDAKTRARLLQRLARYRAADGKAGRS